MLAADARGAGDDVAPVEALRPSNVNSRSLDFAAVSLRFVVLAFLRAGLVLTDCGVAAGVTVTRTYGVAVGVAWASRAGGLAGFFLAVTTRFGGSGFGSLVTWAMIGGAGSAPVITHAAPATPPLRQIPSTAAAGPKRPPPVEAEYTATSERDASRASHPKGSSSASRRVREKRRSRTAARHVAQCRRCGRIETTSAGVAVPAASALSTASCAAHSSPSSRREKTFRKRARPSVIERLTFVYVQPKWLPISW